MSLAFVPASAAGFEDGVAEGLAELERHDVVEDGVDDGGDVVEDARDVVEHGERRLERRRPR